MLTKTCTKCKVEKELDLFPTRKSGKHGRHAWCRGCKKVYDDAHSKKYHADNPDKASARLRSWAERDPEAYRAKLRRAASARRARERNAFIEHIDHRVVAKRDNWTCHLCGGKTETGEVDHIQPLAKGGLHCYENVAWSHRECNRQKGSGVKT